MIPALVSIGCTLMNLMMIGSRFDGDFNLPIENTTKHRLLLGSFYLASPIILHNI